jgi:hypothetical protein
LNGARRARRTATAHGYSAADVMAQPPTLRLNLTACPDNFAVTFLDVASQNLPAPSCQNDCGVGEVRDSFAAMLSVNLNDFDVVAALTDVDICGLIAGCANRSDFIWLETGQDSVLAHELGHILGLGDEYCSRDAGSTCGNCNAGAPPPPNFLGSDLGCDPDAGQGCCDDCSGTLGMCEDDYEICCQGNVNPQGGRCIVSYANAGGPRFFDLRCFAHATNPPDPRSEANPDGQVPMKCAFAHLGSVRMLNMDADIEESGQLSVNSASVGRGRLGIGAPGSAGQFALEVLDGDGNAVYSSAFDPLFRPDPQSAGIDYAAIQFQRATLGIRAMLPDSVMTAKIVARTP